MSESTSKMSLNIVTILGIPVFSGSKAEVLGKIEDFVAGGRLEGGNERDKEDKVRKKDQMIIFTPNPEFLVEADRNSEFKEILIKSDINIPDGTGLVWASRFLSRPIKERISGADLAEKLLEIGNEVGNGKVEAGREVRSEKRETGRETGGKRWVVGVAGARRGNLDESGELIKRLNDRFPCLVIINLDGKSEILNPPVNSLEFTVRAKSEINSKYQNSNLKKSFEFRNSNFDIVFSCQGMMKQEKWILENKDKINAAVFIGVGGSLDFLSGFAKRAPIWLRQIGLEWLWRGLQRPGHWRRIWKATVVFGWMVFKEKLKIIFNFQ